MLSSDEDEVIMFSQYLKWKNIKRKRNRYWINTSFIVLKQRGASVCDKELKIHPTLLQNCYLMSSGIFEVLVKMVASHITKQDTNYRNATKSVEKLLMTLRWGKREYKKFCKRRRFCIITFWYIRWKILYEGLYRRCLFPGSLVECEWVE